MVFAFITNFWFYLQAEQVIALLLLYSNQEFLLIFSLINNKSLRRESESFGAVESRGCECGTSRRGWRASSTKTAQQCNELHLAELCEHGGHKQHTKRGWNGRRAQHTRLRAHPAAHAGRQGRTLEPTLVFLAFSNPFLWAFYFWILWSEPILLRVI